MDDMIKVYVIRYPTGSTRITYINKSRINIIEVIKDSYVRSRYHIFIRVGNCEDPLDIVKDHFGTYWSSEKEAVEFIEKTFGNINITESESFESL